MYDPNGSGSLESDLGIRFRDPRTCLLKSYSGKKEWSNPTSPGSFGLMLFFRFQNEMVIHVHMYFDNPE